MRSSDEAYIGLGLFGFGFLCLAAWVTHIIWVIAKLAGGAATMSQMVLGAIGAFMPPVGTIHGFMIWFGYGA